MKRMKDWVVKNTIVLIILIILMFLFLINMDSASNMTKTNSFINDITGLVAKLGGFTAVVGLICKFSVDYFMEKKTYQYKQEIEKLKHELSSEIEKSKSLNEQVSHKNKLLFDEEVDIYKKISPFVNDVKESILSYIVNAKTQVMDAETLEMIEYYAKINLDKLREVWNLYTFFMEEDIHASLETYLTECFAALDRAKKKDLHNYEMNKEMKKVVEQYNVLKTVIRTHLKDKAELK
ncbi:hypothetical protein [Lacrimispora sp.]|uniref:hypothetical protein n=1 Tax=Lacrimispora sp. TaxID=2719234 RepID=UPI003992631D